MLSARRYLELLWIRERKKLLNIGSQMYSDNFPYLTSTTTSCPNYVPHLFDFLVYVVTKRQYPVHPNVADHFVVVDQPVRLCSKILAVPTWVRDTLECHAFYCHSDCPILWNINEDCCWVAETVVALLCNNDNRLGCFSKTVKLDSHTLTFSEIYFGRSIQIAQQSRNM